MTTKNAHLKEHAYHDGYGPSFPDTPYWTVQCDNHEDGAWVLNSGHHYDDRDAALAKAAEHDAEHHSADVPAHDCTNGDHWPCTAVTAARSTGTTAPRAHAIAVGTPVTVTRGGVTQPWDAMVVHAHTRNGTYRLHDTDSDTYVTVAADELTPKVRTVTHLHASNPNSYHDTKTTLTDRGGRIVVRIDCIPGLNYWTAPDAATMRAWVDAFLKDSPTSPMYPRGRKRDGARVEFSRHPGWGYTYYVKAV